ncbi:MAG TPA: TonB-dependent receptor [Bryobacteraceae bacterium]|jgi:iron complex outermembrane receptor protein|nr:TonB-dependent receptor [Bryobacteraceae bacterium]
MSFRIFRTIVAVSAALAAQPRASAADQRVLPDFGELSLDELANVKITSFTNKQQNLSQVAGAVYVISREQIVRSGLTSVPELLRLAPGVDVAQVNGNQWSVSARGTVGVYSNKLLVLIDGRSIYSPIFSGVYWELGMPILDNIDRIEVVRGPGATIWGANAVLGVINIITRTSRDTRGTTITAGGGSSDRGFGSASFSGGAGAMSYRVYGAGADRAPLSRSSGGSAGDAWDDMQGGFRLDGARKSDVWMLEGDLFRAGENEMGVSPSLATQIVVYAPAQFNSFAGNLTGEWRRRFGSRGELRISSYFDYANRPEPQASRVATGTWDTAARYDFTAGHIHNISVGTGQRLISDKISSGSVTFSPAQLTYSGLNAFAQDEMHFADDAVLFTVGAKLERNHFAGWGTEPSANLLWTPKKHHGLWISAARSLRTPSLFEDAVSAPFAVLSGSPATGGLPVLASFDGSPMFSSESVRDFEAGYRVQVSKIFSADLTGFYDQFSSIRSFVTGNPVFVAAAIPYLTLAETVSNGAAATGKGVEASVAWQVRTGWKLEGSYTYNLIDPGLSASAPPGSIDGGGKVPSRNKWRLQSYLNFSKAWQLDTFFYWTSAASPVTTAGLPDVFVPSYARLDIRLGYKPARNWQISLAGQNLLEPRHLEGLTELLTAYSYVNRSIYLKSTWQF